VAIFQQNRKRKVGHAACIVSFSISGLKGRKKGEGSELGFGFGGILGRKKL